MLSAYKNTAYVLLGGALCKAWQLIFSCFSLCALVKRCLKDKTTEETAGAAVTSFRFNLSDGTSYDLIYACYGVKNGELKSAAGGFKYFTSADIGSYWNNLNTELEAIPINESELP